MKQNEVKLPGKYLLTIHAASSVEATDAVYLFFHGVPAVNYKNEDAARAVSEHTSQDSVVPHYRGLGEAAGKTPDFDFIESIVEMTALSKELAKKYKTVNLVGHSWGGGLALTAWQQLPAEKRGQVILLAPFTELLDETLGEKLKQATAAGILPLRVGAQKTAEHFVAATKMLLPPADIAKLITRDNQFVLIEATDDASIASEFTDILYQKLTASGRLVDRYILQDEHLFPNDRPLLIKTILQAIDKFRKNK